MKRIEFIQDNFLGMSYCVQIKVIEYLKESSKEYGPKRISREFNDVFDDYLKKLKLLLELKEVYPEFNSDKRRLTRKILLENFRDLDFAHHHSYSDENIKNRHYYSGDYYGEGEKYFDAQQVSEEEVKEFSIEYSNLSISQKRKFIEDMTFYYNRVNYFLKLPYPDKMIEAYKPIIQNLLGDDLMEYYNKLYKTEQIELILSLVNEFKWFKYDENNYRYKLNAVKENPIIIRKLKKETIDYCQRYFA